MICSGAQIRDWVLVMALALFELGLALRVRKLFHRLPCKFTVHGLLNM